MSDLQVSTPTSPPLPIWNSRSLQLAMLVLAVCLGISLRAMNLDGVGRRTPDERAYTEGGKVLLARGTSGIAVLAERTKEDTISPANPVRAGYLFLLAGSMRVTGSVDEEAGAKLACAASIVSVILLALLGWRRFSPAVALTAMLLYAVNPAALMTSRRSWEESVVEVVALLMVFLASELVAGSWRLAWMFAFALTGAVAITLKQTAALSFVLCTAWVLFLLLIRAERRKALFFAVACGVAAILAIGWLAHLVGGWQQFVLFTSDSTNSLDANAYSIAYEGGSPWLLLEAFAVVSITTLVLALTGLFSGFDLRRPMSIQRQITLALGIFTSIFLVLVAILPHHLNLRYLAPVFAPVSLLAGVGMAFVLALVERISRARKNVFVGIAALTVISMSALDYWHFRTEFAQPDMQDLSVRMVLAAAKETASPAPVEPSSDFAHWIEVSAQASRAGDCQHTIDAANKAVQLDPNSAVAWNNLAAGYECAKQWTPAIAAAQHALQLQPDFQLAKNNLNWSLEQQRLESSK